MNFRRILLTSATLGSAAVFAAACSNSDNVVLTIPTTDTSDTGQQTADAGATAQPRKDGRYIARCATEAEGDGYAGQTDFTDGSVDFSDYCLQRYYSGVQPAPGAVFVESDSGKSKPQNSPSSSAPETGQQTAQRVPDGSQLLAEGGGGRSTGLSNNGNVGAQGGLGQTNQPADNFGAANAGSPTHDSGTGTTPQNGNGQDGNGQQNGAGQNGNGQNGTGQNGTGQNGNGGGNANGGTTTEPSPGGTTTSPTQPGETPGENSGETPGEGGTTTPPTTQPPITVPTTPITPITPVYPDNNDPGSPTTRTPAPTTTGSADDAAPSAPTEASPTGAGETPAEDITATQEPSRPAPISSQVPTSVQSSLDALLPGAN